MVYVRIAAFYIFLENRLLFSSAVYDFNSDTAIKDWPMFYFRFCGRACINGSLVISPNNIEPIIMVPLCPNCFPCNCDKHCTFLGTCCPTVNQSGTSASYDLTHDESLAPDYLKGIFSRLDCRNPFGVANESMRSSKYLTVTRCPSNWTDGSIRERCEYPDKDSLASITPYADQDSRLLFLNIFCVVCNGLYHRDVATLGIQRDSQAGLASNDPSKLKPLDIEFGCKTFEKLVNMKSAIEMYKWAINSGDCYTVSISVDDSMETHTCLPWVTSVNYELSETSACLKGGDERLKRLCQDLPSIPALTFNGMKNILCYLCEKGNVFKKLCLGSGAEGYRPPMAVLLAPYRREKTSDTILERGGCPTTMWKDDRGECVTPSCPLGKALVESSCNKILLITTQYTLSLIVGSRTPISTENFAKFTSHLDNMLMSSGLAYYELYISLVQSKYREDQQELDVMGDLKPRHGIDIDELEKILVDNLTNPIQDVDYVRNHSRSEYEYESMNLYPICLGTELCGTYRLLSGRGYYVNQTTELFMSDESFETEKQGSEIKTHALDITPSLICSYVEFKPTEDVFIIVQNSSTTIRFSIELRNEIVEIPWTPNVSYVGGHVQVCLKYLQEISNDVQTHRSLLPRASYMSGVLVLVNYYTDIVCLSVSCVLLVVTISTYLLFPSLRTTPGLNTLCLCTSLLSANLSLIVTSVFGTRGLLSEFHCLLHAIFLHYSWVASFVWMSTCCVHMYRVFTGHRVRSKNRSFVLYSVCSFGTPACVVVLVIIITHTTTHGASIGYSDDYCFLDVTLSNLTMILGILTPLIVTVSINSLLFFLTVREMFTVKKMQHQTKSRHGVLTYTKLSTVTGLFCLLSAAGAQFDNVLLSLLSAPFSALQGLFIFISFMANKRVVEMYSRLMFKTADNKNTSRNIPTRVIQDNPRKPRMVSGILVVCNRLTDNTVTMCEKSPQHYDGNEDNIVIDGENPQNVPTWR